MTTVTSGEEALRKARSDVPDLLVLEPDSPSWPRRLEQIDAPPERLWVRGLADLLDQAPLVAVVGIGGAAIVSLPFAIVSQKVNQARMGLYMGLFSLSVVLPQLVVSLGIALFFSRAPDKSVIFALSAASLALSALAWSFVREED